MAKECTLVWEWMALRVFFKAVLDVFGLSIFIIHFVHQDGRKTLSSVIFRGDSRDHKKGDNRDL